MSFETDSEIDWQDLERGVGRDNARATIGWRANTAVSGDPDITDMFRRYPTKFR